jgi:MFS superfamily sulfate permease-like transporter
MVVPQAMAYAMLAGLPPVVGLLAIACILIPVLAIRIAIYYLAAQSCYGEILK